MLSIFTFNESLVSRLRESAIYALLLLCVGCHDELDFPDEEYKSRIIAHRGYKKDDGVPENSLQSFINAANAGLHGCEIDIWTTSDGELVVNHDAVIDSCVIAEMTYHELRNALADKRICEKFSSFLEILPDYPGFKLLVEIKNVAIPAVLDLISSYGVESQIEFQSFSPEVCRKIIDSPFAGPVLLITETDPALSQLVSDGYTGYSLYHFNLDKRNLQQSHALGLQVYVWTVGSWKGAKKLLDKGVDFVIMDYWE